jgi:colicin import membrane protein
MQANSPQSYFLSALFHAVLVAVVLIGGCVFKQQVEDAPKIFELVAGEGDNYMATAAPALGNPNAVKLEIPEPAVTKAPEPEVVPARPTPEPVIERAPVTPEKVTPVKPAPPDAIRDFSKDVKRISAKRQKNMEAKDKKLREIAEKKAKAAEERKSKAMTKAEFDKLNKTKATSAKATTVPKVAKIDGQGIAKGVLGGSTANKTGGAGGKALTREEGEAMDLYFSLLRARLKEALDKPPGLSDSLVAIVEVRIAANGLLSGATIARSSGSADFDHAALAAVARVRSIGPRPDGKSELLSIPFRMREEDEG